MYCERIYIQGRDHNDAFGRRYNFVTSHPNLFCAIGDQKDGIKLQQLSTLISNKIGPDTTIYFSAHGGVESSGDHHVNLHDDDSIITCDVLKILDASTSYPLHVNLKSCHGWHVNSCVNILKPGSVLVTNTGPNQSSSSNDDTLESELQLIIKNDDIVSPAQRFLHMMRHSVLTTTFNHKTEAGNTFVYEYSANDKPLHNPEAFNAFLYSAANDFIKLYVSTSPAHSETLTLPAKVDENALNLLSLLDLQDRVKDIKWLQNKLENHDFIHRLSVLQELYLYEAKILRLLLPYVNRKAISLAFDATYLEDEKEKFEMLAPYITPEEYADQCTGAAIHNKMETLKFSVIHADFNSLSFSRPIIAASIVSKNIFYKMDVLTVLATRFNDIDKDVREDIIAQIVQNTYSISRAVVLSWMKPCVMEDKISPSFALTCPTKTINSMLSGGPRDFKSECPSISNTHLQDILDDTYFKCLPGTEWAE